ncbi:hypothetical protein L1887_27904 [Cichorium endivia]|nr:hypothetical protein L1887_27904 [Cichorium endivia]
MKTIVSLPAVFKLLSQNSNSLLPILFVLTLSSRDHLSRLRHRRPSHGNLLQIEREKVRRRPFTWCELGTKSPNSYELGISLG